MFHNSIAPLIFLKTMVIIKIEYQSDCVDKIKVNEKYSSLGHLVSLCCTVECAYNFTTDKEYVVFVVASGEQLKSN